jgi:hypothetical protein
MPYSTVAKVISGQCHRELLCYFRAAAVTAFLVKWPGFLATDPEVRVRFPLLPDIQRSSGSGTGYSASWVQLRSYLEEIQSKALRMIVDAPWYVPNMVIRRDLQIPTVKQEIRRYSSQYSARLSAHANDLIVNFMALPDNRRLRRHLPTRFLVNCCICNSSF